MSELLRINSGVRQRCFIFPRLLSAYTNGIMKEEKIGMGEMEQRF